MYYLEELTPRDIVFLNQLLEGYRKTNVKMKNNKPLGLPKEYHILKEKIKRLCKYFSYNPFETNTEKRKSKYIEAKKLRRTFKTKKEGKNETT
ncbi:MAG: hypothetical protein LBK08_02035 [Treponema sp.]|jgi:hypothetical protein|nr:hypothetical protein [Treponema sp.]